MIVIAEAGVNHNGDLNMAKRLIQVAAASGADYVKFQTFKTESLAVKNAAQFEMLRALELTPDMHHDLIHECKREGIGFLSTGFDESSIDFLASLGQCLFKIPSGEITNLPYLRHVGSYGKPIILSTGMASLEEVSDAVYVLEKAGVPKQDLTVLHCTTQYPTPMHEVNLKAMLTLREALGVKVGYSDHTMGIEVAIAAVALGAQVIEKHFTLDRDLPGPDHKASLEPNELCFMVQAIRNIEKALGDGVKRCVPGEMPNLAVARKSLVARCAIQAGELFSSQNITAKRPGTGINPMHLDDVIGQTASRDFNPDELIEL